MNKEPVIESSGSVFADLGFSPEEAIILAMRAELMVRIRETIMDKGWTQAEAAGQLGIGQSRVSDLVRGKRDKSSFDMRIKGGGRLDFYLQPGQFISCVCRAID